MVRRHGWQYPAHTYQVVAITVFFILASVFYIFLAPFLGNLQKEYAAIGTFSPVAFVVFFLYIRCTAIDPSDPGVLATGGLSSSAKHAETVEASKEATKKKSFLLSGYFCMLGGLIKDDRCRNVRQSVLDEDFLYCTLCNAEVYKFSKHCRSCDKCVEGFDHHCRMQWLNNCIGSKNYVSFVLLMIACLIMLLYNFVLGLVVLVRCFTETHDIQKHLTDKLGNGFSLAPFTVVVALCTLTPLLASIPLGELFFFHMLLIRKEITTYEYVVAMRAQSEPETTVEVETQSNALQQSGLRGNWSSSSLGLPHHGSWCTPRRVEHNGEPSPRLDQGKLPCTVDADSTTVVEKKGYRSSRHAVKISALKLAMLNPKEASQAAMKARENSSILRPVGFHSFGTSETDCGSSCSVNSRSSMSLDCGAASSRKGLKMEVETASPRQETSKDERDTEDLSCSSSSPGSAPLTPLPAERRVGNSKSDRRHGLPVCNETILPSLSLDHPSWICTTPINEGHDISRGNETIELGRSHIIHVDSRINQENHSGSCNRPAVYWDRAAGRFRSVPNRNPYVKLSRTGSAEPWGPSTPQRAHSVLSPGKCSNFEGPLNISTSQKEKSLKWAGDGHRPFSIHHIVLPSQTSHVKPPIFRSQSSASPCRIMQHSLPHSRFTPS